MTLLYWTEAKVVDAIRLFVQEYDRLPTQIDFEAEDHRFPAPSRVKERFGTWNVAVEAAGFKPRYRTHGGKSGWSSREEVT
jgi:hypothetical protein